MVDVNVALTTLTINTRSGDLVGLGASVTAGQTFDIAAVGKTDDLIILLEEQGGGAATVTFDAGDDPPSKREGIGSLTISLATSDARLLQLEGGRFIQSDGKITGSVASQTVKITAFRTSRKW
jgi:hypothetical protein